MVERLAAALTRWRRSVIACALLLTLPFLPFAFAAPLDNSTSVWMVEDSAQLATFERFRAAFGSDERILAYVRGPRPGAGGARSSHPIPGEERRDASLLRFVHDLARALDDRARFPQVEEVVSIETVAPDEVTVLLDERLGGLAELPRLRRRLESPLARRFQLLDLARDRASVGIALRPGPPDERRALLRELESFRARARGEGRELLLAGEPIVNVELDQGAREVETRFMPLFVSVCVVVMLALTRSVRITTLVLVPVAILVLCVSGLVGATGRSWNLLLVIAKPLVFVLALATSVHIVQSYLQGVRDGLGRGGAAARAFTEKAVPCFFSMLATLDGFGSLATASVRPIREFGALAALGSAAAFAVIAFPFIAALAIVGPERVAGAGEDRFGALAERIVRAAVATRARSLAIVLGCGLVCAASLYSYTRLRVDTNALNYLKPDGRTRSEYEAIEREGLGLFNLEVVVRAKDGSPIGASAPALHAVRAFEKAALARAGVTATLSFADVLVDGSWRATSEESLPDALILGDVFRSRRVLEQSRKLLGEGVGAAARALRVVVFARTGETSELLALMASLAGDFERTAGAHGLAADFTGSFPLMLATQVSLIATLGRSLTGAAVAVAVTLLLLVRSPRRVLLAALPNALPILFGFAVMHASDMPLDVGTVMVSSIVLGIAVDDTIHFLYHYGRARARGEPLVEACAFAARIAGRGLVLATEITVAGFMTLLLSSFAPTWRFGCLAAIGLTVAVAGVVLVLPALLVLFDAEDRALNPGAATPPAAPCSRPGA